MAVYHRTVKPRDPGGWIARVMVRLSAHKGLSIGINNRAGEIHHRLYCTAVSEPGAKE